MATTTRSGRPRSSTSTITPPATSAMHSRPDSGAQDLYALSPNTEWMFATLSTPEAATTRKTANDVRQPPDDLVVHSGDRVAADFHRMRGEEPDQHEQRAAAASSQKLAGGGTGKGKVPVAILDPLVADAGREPQVGAQLATSPRRRRDGRSRWPDR